MEFKDWVPIILSIIALLVSGASIRWSWESRQRERRVRLRLDNIEGEDIQVSSDSDPAVRATAAIRNASLLTLEVLDYGYDLGLEKAPKVRLRHILGGATFLTPGEILPVQFSCSRAEIQGARDNLGLGPGETCAVMVYVRYRAESGNIEEQIAYIYGFGDRLVGTVKWAQGDAFERSVPRRE